jgi:alpha-tubulin suppressor-like RCC1 family protein
VNQSGAVSVPGLSDVRRLALGGFFSCALRTDGTVLCWGDNQMGQLGDGTTQARTSPVAVVGLDRVEEIAAGHHHACARLLTGEIFCWGGNGSGQLGDGTATDRSAPVRVALQ